MVEPFMKSIQFQCPNCGHLGMAAKLREMDEYRLVEGLKKETREGNEEIVCANCGSVSEPEKPI